jgi:putative SbcD/Mre11-related phosphoesterase
MTLKFIRGERALVVEDYLVISDLHIGYSKVLNERGYIIPSQSKEFIERIKKLKKETNTNKLIILGDVKHNIPYTRESERIELMKFFKELSVLFNEVIITKGNHDGKIERYIFKDNIKVTDELLLNEVAFMHGHKYPSEEAMKKKVLILGHTHPSFKITDKSGVTHNYPCWVIGRIDKSKLKRYAEIRTEKVVIMPPFNKLLYGTKEIAGPLSKAIKVEEILLLDMTRVV